jgi:orotidine-5'-phosphate decarboxylase
MGRKTSFMSIIAKYDARVQAINSLVCIGLDTDVAQLPAAFQSHATPQFAYNQYIIEQTHAYAAAYKPNIAFYEARGEQGLRELHMTMAYLHEHHPTIFTICDAKRGDNHVSNQGYVAEIFDLLGFDSVTLHPYLGQEALAPFLARADKGCIILCRTSNAGAAELQDVSVGISGDPLWLHVARMVAHNWNANNNCMLVAGATYPDDIRRIRTAVGDMTLLVPGVGAQGGDAVQTVQAGKNSVGRGLIISSSRAILWADDPAEAARALRDEINDAL